MPRDHCRPFLLVDDSLEIFHAASRVLERLGRWRPLVLIPQAPAVRRYLTDSVVEERLPLAILLRTHRGTSESTALLEWIHKQPDPLSAIQILVVTDDWIGAAGRQWLDVRIENVFREILHRSSLPGGLAIAPR